MRNTLRKIIAMTVAASVMLPISACDSKDEAVNEVIEETKDFCSDLVEKDIKDVFEYCFCISDEKEQYYTDKFDNSKETSDYIKVLEAVNSTVTFEPDSESAYASSKEEAGSVNVTFSMIDFESVAAKKEKWEDADEIIEEMANCEDRVNFDITIEWVLGDNEWLIMNYKDVFDSYLQYQHPVVDIVTKYDDYIEYTNWFYSDTYGSSVHTNTDKLELDMWIDAEDTNIEWQDLSYDVKYNGDVVYSSTSEFFSYYSSSDVYTRYMYSFEFINTSFERPYLQSGTYEIIAMDSDGIIVCDCSCEVIYDESAVPDFSGQSYLIDSYDFWDENGYVDIYVKTDYLELNIWKYEYIDWSGCYFQITNSDNEVVYEAYVINYESSVSCIWQSDSLIPQDNYTFNVYAPDGSTIENISCPVRTT